MARNPSRNPLGSARPSSARALLLVMIGEFVWPAGQPAWSSTLISGLAEFGIESAGDLIEDLAAALVRTPAAAAGA